MPPPGSFNAELQVGTNFRFVVHQAAGMASVQLGVSVADALVRLRAHAFAVNGGILELAEDVVERRFRFADRVVDNEANTWSAVDAAPVEGLRSRVTGDRRPRPDSSPGG